MLLPYDSMAQWRIAGVVRSVEGRVARPEHRVTPLAELRFFHEA
eukprot:COSAG03_NODE_777_length_5900_cov_22.520428_3_plen_44_part_00